MFCQKRPDMGGCASRRSPSDTKFVIAPDNRMPTIIVDEASATAILGVRPKKPAAKGEPSAGQYFCSKDDRWLVFTHVAWDANHSKLLQDSPAPGRDAACMPPRQGAAIRHAHDSDQSWRRLAAWT